MMCELFESLELPVQPVALEELTQAYAAARETWFFRQYEPEYVLDARDRLARIDQAYRTLRDLRRQPAIIREAKAERRIARREAGLPSDSASITTSSGGPRLTHRPRVVRGMLRTAEEMVSRSGRPLNEDEIRELVRSGFEQGLDYAEATQIVERIARDLSSRTAKFS